MQECLWKGMNPLKSRVKHTVTHWGTELFVDFDPRWIIGTTELLQRPAECWECIQWLSVLSRSWHSGHPSHHYNSLLVAYRTPAHTLLTVGWLCRQSRHCWLLREYHWPFSTHRSKQSEVQWGGRHNQWHFQPQDQDSFHLLPTASKGAAVHFHQCVSSQSVHVPLCLNLSSGKTLPPLPLTLRSSWLCHLCLNAALPLQRGGYLRYI